MKLSSFLFFFMMTLMFFQCKKHPENDILLASVYGAELYESDLSNIETGVSISEKSREMLIDSWIRNQLLLHKASLSAEDKSEIEKLVNDFQESLIVQKYKEKVIQKKLLQDVSEEEINVAYQSLKSESKMNAAIYKIELLVVSAFHVDKLDLKNFFEKKNFEEWKNSINGKFDLFLQDTSQWYKYHEFSQHIPANLIKESDLSNSDRLFVEDEEHLFFLRIVDKVDKNEIAPLSYMKDKIKRSIIENRRKEVMKVYISELYNSALQQNQIKINQVESEN